MRQDVAEQAAANDGAFVGEMKKKAEEATAKAAQKKVEADKADTKFLR